MRISGLSNQWKTRDRLLNSVSADPSPFADPLCNERSIVIHSLLQHLESIDGPDVWIGSSHRLLNFNLRDTLHQFDDIPSYLTVEPYDISCDPPKCGYRIGFSVTGGKWLLEDVVNVDDACRMIARLLHSLTVNRQ